MMQPADVDTVDPLHCAQKNDKASTRLIHDARVLRCGCEMSAGPDSRRARADLSVPFRLDDLGSTAGWRGVPRRIRRPTNEVSASGVDLPQQTPKARAWRWNCLCEAQLLSSMGEGSCPGVAFRTVGVADNDAARLVS